MSSQVLCACGPEEVCPLLTVKQRKHSFLEICLHCQPWSLLLCGPNSDAKGIHQISSFHHPNNFLAFQLSESGELPSAKQVGLRLLQRFHLQFCPLRAALVLLWDMFLNSPSISSLVWHTCFGATFVNEHCPPSIGDQSFLPQVSWNGNKYIEFCAELSPFIFSFI